MLRFKPAIAAGRWGFDGGEAKSDCVEMAVRDAVELTPHTSHLTPHTSHLTPHTSHLTPHTSHLTPHTPQVREVVELVLWDDKCGAFNMEWLPPAAMEGLRDM